jgi:hypothetical protein
MRHPTYKHLDAKLRLGAFTLGQWAQITVAGLVAALFGGYVSPLPTQATIFVSILLAGLPVALSYGTMGVDFSIAQLARAAWRYWQQPRRFPPGPGRASSGYVLTDDPARADSRADAPAHREAEAVWDV